MMSKVKKLRKHNNRGHSVLYSEFRDWRDPDTGSDIFGPVIAYSWVVNEEVIVVNDIKSEIFLCLLPDSSGLLCFERPSFPSNCLLLDAHGKERMRLTVPWQLTKPQNPESAKPPTSFAFTSDPYTNPADGKLGEFGVTAWVEHAGMYYFELDYHTGQFLWGREIRD